MTEAMHRQKQQLTGVKHNQEELVVKQRQREGRRRNRKEKKKKEEGKKEEEREKEEEIKSHVSRLIVSEDRDGFAIGNPTMFLLGLFALAVGGIALGSQFLPGTPVTRRVDYT